jgi:hypothetical protein
VAIQGQYVDRRLAIVTAHAKQFERLEVCEVCGKKQIDGGYNERGWPIDSEGREMPCE